MALHVCILGIDGSGKSTVVDTLPDMLAGLSGVRVASVGERYRVADPEQTILAPGFRPRGVPFAARLSQGFKWASKRCTASLRLYPFFKVLQLAFQDAAARRLESRYRPDVVVSDGNLILSVVGRAVNYLQPARNTPTAPWDVDLANVREAFAQLDGVIPASGWTRILTGLAQTLRRIGLHILWLPDVVILLDLKPETAMHRISSRGGRIDPHENPADLGRAGRMYARTLEALTTCRGKSDLICVPVDRRTPGEVMHVVSEQVQRHVNATGRQRSDEETLGRLEGTKAAWRSFLNAGYLGKCLVSRFFRGTWREPLFPLSRIGRSFMSEGYSASVMQAIYDQDHRRSSLLERAFNGYPLHRAVYDRLQLLVPRITQELMGREGRVRILSAPCGLAEDVFRSVDRAKDSAPDGARVVDFTAVDLDPNGRIAANVCERGLNSGVDVRFVKGDLTDPTTWTDNLDGPFDIALFVGLTGWLPKPDLIEHLVRLRHCLRDDGVLLTDVFTAGPYALSGWYAGYRAHYYEPAVFASLLEASGFDPASVSVAGGRDGLNHVMACRPKPRDIPYRLDQRRAGDLDVTVPAGNQMVDRLPIYVKLST